VIPEFERGIEPNVRESPFSKFDTRQVTQVSIQQYIRFSLRDGSEDGSGEDEGA
jgi:hypothetical protein